MRARCDPTRRTALGIITNPVFNGVTFANPTDSSNSFDGA